jgi:ethanolamine-phosphate cytidylyltransferase
MELHERALSVLACRYTDEVIIGAPSVITEDLLTTFNISMVVRGTMHEINDRTAASEDERYSMPSERGMLKYLNSPSSMTSAQLIQRIVKNREQFENRQEKKKASEKEYYLNDKAYVAEI